MFFCFLTYFGLSHAHVSAFRFQTALVFHTGLSLSLAWLSVGLLRLFGKHLGPAPTPRVTFHRHFPSEPTMWLEQPLWVSLGLQNAPQQWSRELGKTTRSCVTHMPAGFHSTRQFGGSQVDGDGANHSQGAAPIRGERTDLCGFRGPSLLVNLKPKAEISPGSGNQAAERSVS